MPNNVLTATIKVNTTGVKAAFDETADAATKAKTSLSGTDEIVQDIVSSSKNLNDALNKLASQGLLSINSLENSIKDFKEAFRNATDPADIKRFGDGLKALEARQRELINSGLGVAAAEEKVAKAHASNAVGVQRLSSSFIGLSRVFQVLPPELAHLTHGFDQIFQSFERTAHGTETTGDAVKKFAGVLGQVGLGLAIGVVVGLLADFVKGLFDGSAALEKATEQSIEFSNAIKRIDEDLKDFKERSKFLTELGDLVVDINFGKGFEGDLLKLQSGMVGLVEQNSKLTESAKEAGKEFNKAFQFMQDGISDAGRAAVSAINDLKSISDEQLKSLDLSDADTKLIESVRKTGTELVKIQKEIHENEDAQTIQAAKNRALRADKDREDAKKVTHGISADLQERLNIIKEFTAKFATIKDPFPDFFTKNLPVGKVENKGLRAALDNAFKVLEQASRDLFNTNRIDPGTIPLEIKFKPEIVGKSELVREIEDKFGDIKKDIEDAVNKGIFIVPIDFKTAPEGDGQALKQIESLVDILAKSIEGLSGQKKAILKFHFDINKLDPAVAEKVLKDAEDEINRFASDVPLELSVDANMKVTAKPDKDAILKELNRAFNDITKQFANDSASTLGEAFGDALSGKGLGDGFKKLGEILSGALASLGKALIAAGIKVALAKAAISKLFANPALSIAAGIALVALSQVLKNSIGGREKGGPVKKGSLYEVNERGREIFQTNSGKPYLITGGRQFFTPPVSGKIIPHHQTEKILNSFKTTKVNSTRVMNSVSNSIKNFSGYRAGGGAVVAGNSYIVNERGREIFIPNTGQSINVPQPTTGLRNGGISINLTGGVEISGNKLIAVLANAQRNQKVFV